MEIPSTRLPLFAKSLRILHNFVDSPDISPREEFVPILTLQLVVFPSKLFRFLLLQLRFPRVPIFAFTSPRFVPENPMILEAKPYISGYRFVPRTHLCTYTHLVFVSFVHLRAPNNQNSITTTSTCGQERAYFFFVPKYVDKRARAHVTNDKFIVSNASLRDAIRGESLNRTRARAWHVYIPQIGPDIL